VAAARAAAASVAVGRVPGDARVVEVRVEVVLKGGG
jgi:hypothetical protein